MHYDYVIYSGIRYQVGPDLGFHCSRKGNCPVAPDKADDPVRNGKAHSVISPVLEYCPDNSNSLAGTDNVQFITELARASH
jgi:hypothetical protein